jgi:hypothetical protein
MNYYYPHEVISPQDHVKFIEIIHDGKDGEGNGEDAFSIAKLTWDGKPCIGIRWNIAINEFKDEKKINGDSKCVGIPSSRGFPVWFIIPNELLDPNSEIFKRIQDKK